MPFADYDSMEDCISKNEGKVDDPGAYCASIHKKATGEWPSQKESRSPDFNRIYDEFRKYYGAEKCDAEYYSWVSALGVDEEKNYSRCMERFSFAEQNMKFWREDASSKYYKVLVGFPITSMNNHVYTEQELNDHATKLTDVRLDLNHHKREYGHRTDWFLNGVRYEVAKFEDGAVEAVLKVPKGLIATFDSDFKMQYPNYWGKPIYELIDKGEIVNQSLEADRANSDFFEGSALLTKDVLPGIPLSRIFPLEKIMVEAFSQNRRKKVSVKVTYGGKSMVEKKEARDETNIQPNYVGMPSDDLDKVAKAHAKEPPTATTGVSATMVIPDNSGRPVIPHTSPDAELERTTLAVDKLKLEAEVKALGEKNTYIANDAAEKTMKLMQAEGSIKTLQEQIRQMGGREDRLVNEAKERDRMLMTKDRTIEDVTAARDGFKAELEKIKPSYDDVSRKYADSLKTNLELSKKLRETNEQYIVAAKDKNALEEKYAKQKRLGKIIAKT